MPTANGRVDERNRLNNSYFRIVRPPTTIPEKIESRDAMVNTTLGFIGDSPGYTEGPDLGLREG